MSSAKRTTSVASDLDREGKVDDCIDIIIPSHDGTPFFEVGDGDLQLWVGEECFETHKYLIKRFNGLKELSHTRATTAALHVPLGVGGHSSEDFRHTLKSLASILVSALRIATVFDYPLLRSYTIKHLERAGLSAIERIKVAREFYLASWEEPAYLELCDRDEAITIEEAGVLGMDAFVRVAGIREREQRRRGKELDIQDKEHRAESLGSAGLNNDFVALDVLHSGLVSPAPSLAKEADTTTEPDGINFKPSFTDTRLGHDYTRTEWIGSSGKRIPISSCECRFLDVEGTDVYAQKTCTITPCAAMAFKNLQTQQIAHTNAIAHLQSNLNELAATSSPHTISEMFPASTNGASVREEVRHMILAIKKPQAPTKA